MCCWWEVEGTRNTLEIPHFVPGSLAQPCCRVRRREWEYREPREEAVSVHLYLQLRCVQGLGLASRPELGCRSYSGALCDVSAWCGERCCCLPLTSAVLPKDFTTTAAAYRWRASRHLPYLRSCLFLLLPPCIYIRSFGYTFLSPRCSLVLFTYLLPALLLFLFLLLSSLP